MIDPPNRFGLGFMLPPEGAGFGSAGATAFGHPSDGGSIGFADPDAHLGFGYVVNQLHAGMPPDRTARPVLSPPTSGADAP